MTKTEGIIITKTPFRVSLLGGGTDFPAFFNQHGGATLGMAINKYLYVTANSLTRLFDKRIRVSYSKLEMVDDYSALQHPYVRQIMITHEALHQGGFLDIHTFSDLPAASGMGSSSAFTVGFLNALYLLNGRFVQPKQLAQEAIHIERVELQEAGGWQDQVFAAYGGFNRIDYANHDFSVKPLAFNQHLIAELEASMIMVFTRQTRSSAQVQATTPLAKKHTDHDAQSHAMKALVDQAEATLTSQDSHETIITKLGQLLDEAWQLKKQLSSSISNPHIDQLYEKGKQYGAIGGKLCGAGGGGFLLFIVPAAERKAFTTAMSDEIHIDFKIESRGSGAIYSNFTDNLVTTEK